MTGKKGVTVTKTQSNRASIQNKIQPLSPTFSALQTGLFPSKGWVSGNLLVGGLRDATSCINKGDTDDLSGCNDEEEDDV